MGQPADAFFEALRSRGRTLVMGVVNATPDSFSDGGRTLLPDDAAAAARTMAAEGAAIVDVGGESTRPGADPVDEATELRRVTPVLERLRGELPLSIDTRRAAVARRALELGAVLVNDVSAGGDPDMLPLVAARGAGIVLMHMRGEPATMQAAPSYEDVVGEVEAFLLARAEEAARAGVPRDRILVDPGIGFGKRLPHNLALLAALPRLAGHGWPVLVGVSRKTFLGDLTGRPAGGRRDATTAAVAIAVLHGAAVVRVHDVQPARDAVAVAQGYRRALLEL
ncbi:MAG TPA: dihydropteroate synthase [Planctomycetota bacterium]|nr:dihydropteroate synthase [Planctomycetota bacterium]